MRSGQNLPEGAAQGLAVFRALSMKRAIATGAAWMILARWALRFIGIVSTLVLARLLSPEDFGLVAMATTVIALIELMSWLGIESTLIRHRNPTREHYDTAWSLTVCAFVLCAAITAALAYPTALYFREPRLTEVILVIAAAWALQSFENVGVVDFRRNLQFDREFRFMTFKKLAGFVVGIAAAFAWRSYWALVAGIVASRLAGLVLSYTMHPMRPRWSFMHWREMLSFSRATLANGALQFAATRIPHFFIGRQIGPAPLGTYAIAEEIANVPMTELVDPIGRALFPAYSKLAEDRDALARYVLFVNAAVVAVAVPACVGIALVAAPTVLLALGPRWADAIALIQVLALGAGCMTIRSNSWSLYYAIGRPSFTTRLWILKVVVLLALIWPLYQRFGIIGVAYADLLSSSLLLVADIAVLLRCLGIRPRTYLAAIFRPLAASVLMATTVLVTSNAAFGPIEIPGSAVDHAWRLICSAALGAISYGAAMLSFWHFAGRPVGIEQEALDRLHAWWRTRQSAA